MDRQDYFHHHPYTQKAGSYKGPQCKGRGIDREISHPGTSGGALIILWKLPRVREGTQEIQLRSLLCLMATAETQRSLLLPSPPDKLLYFLHGFQTCLMKQSQKPDLPRSYPVSSWTILAGQLCGLFSWSLWAICKFGMSLVVLILRGAHNLGKAILPLCSMWRLTALFI